MIFTVSALLLVGAANYWLFFVAPKMQCPGFVNFVLVESKKAAEQKAKAEEKGSWIEHLVTYGVIVPLIILGQLYPAFGFGLLILLALGVGIYFTFTHYEMWILWLILVMQRPQFFRLEPLRALILRLALRLRILRPINGPLGAGPSKKSPSGQSSSTAA
jgi:hypothetical protein